MMSEAVRHSAKEIPSPRELSIRIRRVGTDGVLPDPAERFAGLVTADPTVRAKIVAFLASAADGDACVMLVSREGEIRLEEAGHGTTCDVLQAVYVDASGAPIAKNFDVEEVGFAPLILLAAPRLDTKLMQEESAIREAATPARLCWVALSQDKVPTTASTTKRARSASGGRAATAPSVPEAHPLWPLGSIGTNSLTVLADAEDAVEMAAARAALPEGISLVTRGLKAPERQAEIDVLVPLLDENAFSAASVKVPRPMAVGKPARPEAAEVDPAEKISLDISNRLDWEEITVRSLTLLLPEGRSADALALPIRKALSEIGAPLQVLGEPRFTPLDRQILAIDQRDQIALSDLLMAAGDVEDGGPQRDRIEAQIAAMRGAQQLANLRETNDQREAVGAKIAEGRKRLKRIIEFGFDQLRQDIALGKYGKAGDGTGKDLENKWIEQRHSWVLEQNDPTVPDSLWRRFYDKTSVLKPSETVKEAIATAIHERAADDLAELNLLYELTWDVFIRGEIERDLRDRASRAGRDYDLVPLRGTKGSALPRALETIASREVLAQLKGDPEINRVPARYNKKVLTKSTRVLLRQGTKLVAALVLLGIALPDISGPNPDDGSPSLIDQIGSILGGLSNITFAEVFRAFVDIWNKVGTLLLLVFLALIVMVPFALGELRSLREVQFDKLSQKTHDALRKAADKQLAAARLVFEEVMERDIRAMERQLIARADSILNELDTGRAFRIAQVEAARMDLERQRDEEAARLKTFVVQRSAARQKAVEKIKKIFALRGVGVMD